MRVEKRTSSVKRAAMITAASRYSVVVFNLLFTMVLARILTPNEFGIVSVTSVFTAFFLMLADVGFARGVIQDKTLTEDDITGIYSINIYISLVIGLVFMPFSVGLAWFYGNEIYVPMGALLSVVLFFSSARSIPNALFMKEKRFLLVGVVNVFAAVAGGVAAIVMALFGFGVYALVMQTLITALASFAWQDVMARREFGVRFSLRPSLSGIHKIFGYSMNQFGFDSINYFARNLDNILIGKVMGSTALGFYDKAYKLSTYPLNYLTFVISSALHPILSEYQDDVEYIYHRYISVAKFLSLSGVFISSICYFGADEVILFAFGDQWGEAVAPFKMLTISMWFQMTVSSCGAIYQSLGHTDTMLRSCLVFVPIQVLCIVVGVFSGSLGRCAALVALSFILKFFVDYYFLIAKTFRMSYAGFLRKMLPDLIITAAIAFVQIGIGATGVLNGMGAIASLAVKCLTVGAVFAVAVKATGEGRYLKAALPKKLRGK